MDKIWIMAETNKKNHQKERLKNMDEIDENLTQGWKKWQKNWKNDKFQWLDQQKCKINERLKESDEIDEFW